MWPTVWTILKYIGLGFMCICVSVFVALYIWFRYRLADKNKAQPQDVQGILEQHKARMNELKERLKLSDHMKQSLEEMKAEVKKNDEEFEMDRLKKEAAAKPEPFFLRIITGASSNHYKSLYQLLDSICIHNEPTEVDLIVWDLGLTELQKKVIESEFSLKLRTFDYSKYPGYFNIQVEAGQYAWKPVLIEETTKELGEGRYLWLDAGDKITKSLKDVHAHIAKQGIYSPPSSGLLSEWTYVKVFDAIDPVYRSYMRLPMCTGGVQGYNTKFPWVQDFLIVFADWAKRKEVIAPEGSNRQNHRQDQTLLSLLYWDAQKMHRFDTIANFANTIRIHQDID